MDNTVIIIVLILMLLMNNNKSKEDFADVYSEEHQEEWCGTKAELSDESMTVKKCARCVRDRSYWLSGWNKKDGFPLTHPVRKECQKLRSGYFGADHKS